MTTPDVLAYDPDAHKVQAEAPAEPQPTRQGRDEWVAGSTQRLRRKFCTIPSVVGLLCPTALRINVPMTRLILLERIQRSQRSNAQTRKPGCNKYSNKKLFFLRQGGEAEMNNPPPPAELS
jgi:hypothetical protein